MRFVEIFTIVIYHLFALFRNTFLAQEIEKFCPVPLCRSFIFLFSILS